jgi:hypothetical protein
MTETQNTKWDGSSMSQLDFMEKDTVLVLDDNDNIIGSESKKGSHIFDKKNPRGVLHRAFSVFIFDESTNELLLQQRAAEKITFPSVSFVLCSVILYYVMLYLCVFMCVCGYTCSFLLYNRTF